MKKTLFMCGMIALMLGMISCKSKTDSSESSVSTADNSQNSLDWEGTYSGILPCADCSGIATTIKLKKDQKYELTQTYLDKEDNRFDSSGKFEWNKAGNTITLEKDDNLKHLLVGENSLTILDLEGNKITGELADYYILTKVDMNLVEKHWKLTELFGNPVTTPEGGKEAHIIFKVEGSRVHGNSGCNSFNGTYTLKPGNRISFSHMASTLMMCVNMDTETKMNQVFDTADNYAINGDTLVLNKARMAPLARFQAVY